MDTDVTRQRRALRIAFRNFCIALGGMVVLASLLVLPPATFIVGWLNASVTAIGPMTSLFLIPTVIGFVSLLVVAGLGILRQRWIMRRMAWGAAFGALGGVIFWGLERAANQPTHQPPVLMWAALYAVIVAMLAVVFSSGVSTPHR